MQGKEERAEKHFLGDRTGDEITPPDPATQGLMYIPAIDPLSPARVDDGPFEQWTSKDACGE